MAPQRTREGGMVKEPQKESHQRNLFWVYIVFPHEIETAGIFLDFHWGFVSVGVIGVCTHI